MTARRRSPLRRAASRLRRGLIIERRDRRENIRWDDTATFRFPTAARHGLNLGCDRAAGHFWQPHHLQVDRSMAPRWLAPIYSLEDFRMVSTIIIFVKTTAPETSPSQNPPPPFAVLLRPSCGPSQRVRKALQLLNVHRLQYPNDISIFASAFSGKEVLDPDDPDWHRPRPLRRRRSGRNVY